jgi:holo-[acyl-carrier protein] synthase
VDILQVARMARLVSENPGIVDAVFTHGESEYCLPKRRCHEHLAARFAAKEAVLKAFGTGLGQRMRWTDIEILHDTAGRPRICLHGEVAQWAQRQGLAHVDVSLAHTADLAIAQALAVWDTVQVAQSSDVGCSGERLGA